jgi:putative transposase
MAIWQRKPKAGLIMHAEQGSQYSSHQYRNLLSAHGINIMGSMSRKGDCWGNAGTVLCQKAASQA